MELDLFTRIKVCLKSCYLQGSWNYEKMQNGGFCYALLPAIKKLYPQDKQDEAIKRNLSFFNAHPYVASPIIGIILNMEEAKANGKEVKDEEFENVKNALMGPLSGVADPVFWFTLRSVIGAISAYYAISASIYGPLLFFIAWNLMRLIFMWVTQELGYKKGVNLIFDLKEDFLNNITKIASIVCIFMIGVFINKFIYIELINYEITAIIETLLPCGVGLLFTLLFSYLLKKNVSPILLMVIAFSIGVVFYVI